MNHRFLQIFILFACGATVSLIAAPQQGSGFVVGAFLDLFTTTV